MELIILDQDFGYQDFRLKEVQEVMIDASSASWRLANIGDELNRYPVLIDESDNVILLGGTIIGEVSLELDWSEVYVNSAAVSLRNTSRGRIKNWTVSRAWDGVRVDGDQFTIEDVHLQDIRDDAVENDTGMNGVIRNSLFDGVFVGLSAFDSNTPDRTENLIKMDGVLIRMTSYLFRGEMTHGGIFKVSNPSPKLDIRNSVFAIEKVDHFGWQSMRDAWSKMTFGSGNLYLNLSDDPLPEDYPLPPRGFTVLNGADARAKWQDVRADWLARNR